MTDLRWFVPFVVPLALACATPQRGSGALVVTPLYNPSAIPRYLGVDGQALFAHGGDAGVDFVLEEQPDGCARGNVNGHPIQVCPVTEPGQPPGVKRFRLDGPLGSRTFTAEVQGDRVRVDFGINQGRAEFVVPEGLLRERPELLGGAFYYGAFGLPRPGSDLQAYLIQPRRG
jgi:hypothetical protein